MRTAWIGTALLALGCGETPECENPGPLESCPAGDGACYNISLEGHWSAQAQGVALPKNAHFTVLVGSVHNESRAVWRQGELSSPGVEEVAETGKLSRFRAEHQAARDRGDTASLVCGDRIGARGVVHTSVVVPKSRPFLSVLSMVAPSSDWFVGVDSLPLLADDGSFKESVQVWLLMNDAGTERDDKAFSLKNEAQSPPEPISENHDQIFSPGAPPLALLSLERVR